MDEDMRMRSLPDRAFDRLNRRCQGLYLDPVRPEGDVHEVVLQKEDRGFWIQELILADVFGCMAPCCKHPHTADDQGWLHFGPRIWNRRKGRWCGWRLVKVYAIRKLLEIPKRVFHHVVGQVLDSLSNISRRARENPLMSTLMVYRTSLGI